MKFHRKVITSLFLVGMLILAACVGSDDGDDSFQSTESPEIEAPATEAPADEAPADEAPATEVPPAATDVPPTPVPEPTLLPALLSIPNVSPERDVDRHRIRRIRGLERAVAPDPDQE